jgi:protein gp37
MDVSKGKYWSKGIQLVEGCTPCSPGCDHCWSAGMAHRFRRGETEGRYTDKNGRFDGTITLHLDRLEKAVRVRKPQVFSLWNDLFHESVPSQFINDAWNLMFNNNKHTYLVLTKRPARMAKWLRMAAIVRHWHPEEICPDNIYLGLTSCNQAEADAKIPIFLRAPGKKFLSVEPMLEDIDLSEWVGRAHHPADCGHSYAFSVFDAVLCGAETGPGARPVDPDWVRSIRDQCQSAGVPFFLKQINKKRERVLNGRTHDELPWYRRFRGRENE